MELLGTVHGLLNLAALLLWVRWRQESLQSRRPVGRALLSTLKKAGTAPVYRWTTPGLLAGLLLVRAVGYWQMGVGLRWTPSVDLGAIVLPFRSDLPGRMVVFSIGSFGVFLGAFYLWLLLLSAVNRRLPDTDPWQNWVRAQLGWAERLPTALKWLAPGLGAALVWMGLGPLLSRLGWQIPARDVSHLVQQAGVIGLAAFLVWKPLLVGVLLVHLITSYVFVGHAPFWSFVNVTARHLLKPLARVPLRLGRIDLAPVVGIALVLAVGEAGSRWLPVLYRRLPW